MLTMKITVGTLEWPSPDGCQKVPVQVEVPARKERRTIWDPDKGPIVFEELVPDISQDELERLKRARMKEAQAKCDKAWEKFNKKYEDEEISDDELRKIIFGKS